MRNVNEFFRESNYNNLRILLTICGVWPFQAFAKRCAMYVAFTVLFVSVMIFELVCLFKVWPDFFEVFDCLSMLFFSITSTFKLIYTVYKLPKMKTLLLKIQEHWCSLKTDQEIKILRSYLLFARNLSYIYAGTIVGHAVIFALTPLITRLFYEKSVGTIDASNQTQETQPTYRINYVLDLQMRYIPLLIQCSICEVYYTILLTAFNVFYLACVQHCCGLFAALRYRLERAFESEDNGDDLVTTFTQNKSYSNIVYSVRKHAEAIQFAIAIESLYRLPFFIHMIVNGSLLSIVGFQLMTNKENISRLLPYASYLNALMLNTFFENWQGQKIIDCNEKVHESAYKLQWYRMPVVSQKLLIMIMMRSKKPLTITAGKFIVLSYVTFNAIMRTAFSYFTLLRSVQ
ncbi:odorant receptor Or2-like [Formica exsecta]|uniref:odorant receptor Or2-like n=1 Tax=Formica exsecta TaxID=72781 RepID=UPI001143C63F|nr:odorant receptor Or2-like [Formica exsecta]